MGTAANAIRVDGLTDFRKKVKKLSPNVAKNFRKELKGVAEIVAADARAHTPVVTGHAAASVRATTSGSNVAVRAGGDAAPYYPWLDFGGLLKPTGGRRNYIERERIKKGRYLYVAIDRHHDELMGAAQTAIEHAARDSGLTLRR